MLVFRENANFEPMAFLKKIEKFETHHKVTAFLAVMALTIAVARIGTLFYDPNPVIFHLELHHFDYGVLLLIVTSLILLFGKRPSGLFLILGAVAVGLIIDEYWFIRRAVEYRGSMSSVIVFATLVVLLAFFSDSVRKKK